VAEPLGSGRIWQADPAGNPNADIGLSARLRWVRDENDHGVRARFTWASDRRNLTLMYAVAVERIAYVLADELGLPVPITHLDTFGGQPGAAQIFVPGPTWNQAEHANLGLRHNVVNRDVWPLAVLFDIWLANTDRHERNIMLSPEPPNVLPGVANASTSWLIDHERCGLWPPQKFGVTQVGQVAIPPDGKMPDAVESMIVQVMPASYIDAFATLDAAAREPHLDRIRRFPEDSISAAVEEVPRNYISRRGQELTMQLLIARRDNIANLASAVLP
jgi:hypothetical protein